MFKVRVKDGRAFYDEKGNFYTKGSELVLDEKTAKNLVELDVVEIVEEVKAQKEAKTEAKEEKEPEKKQTGRKKRA